MKKNNIITKVNNHLEYNILNKYNIINAYTLKGDKDYRDIENYKELCKELNINYNNLVKCKQHHTDNIYIVENTNNNLIDSTDALITNKNNIILATVNADCILFILYDTQNKVIANVHSGWLGTLQEIVIKTVKQMHTRFNSNYQDIICCISPSIRKCHFEVDKDVKKMFYNTFINKLNINNYISIKNNKYYIDTININIDLLLKLGLKKENIYDSNICSVCNSDEINSYRADYPNDLRATQIVMLQ